MSYENDYTGSNPEQDEMDRQAMIAQLAQQNAAKAPAKGSMDDYMARLNSNVVSKDPAQREREFQDAVRYENDNGGKTDYSKASISYDMNGKGSVSGGSERQAAPAPGAAAPGAAQGDTSKWDLDGYSKPGYVATAYGAAPAGFDGAKWNDPNHQSPKYVVGRILTEGNMQDPNARAAAIEHIKQAYPGAAYNGKDQLTMPDGGTIDIFKGASAGQFIPQWTPLTEAGGKPVPQGAGPAAPRGNAAGGYNELSTSDAVNALTEDGTFEEFQRRLQQILGPASMDRAALLSMLGKR